MLPVVKVILPYNNEILLMVTLSGFRCTKQMHLMEVINIVLNKMLAEFEVSLKEEASIICPHRRAQSL